MQDSLAAPLRLSDALCQGARIAILAPHPDDESLGTGGLIQQALAKGAEVKVIFVTDGDNNPWPQRYLERRWSIGPTERQRWGARRRQEGLTALQTLSEGYASKVESFSLGLPDAEVQTMWMAGADGPRSAFHQLFRDWQPSLVILPSDIDRHTDHQATHRYGLAALADSGIHASVYSYLIHRPWSQKFSRRHLASDALTLTAEQTNRKLRAILCHETQMALSRNRFSQFAVASERYTLIQIS